MSQLAWRILAIFIEHDQKHHNGEYGSGYLAEWHIADRLGVERTMFSTYLPGTEYDAAIKELKALGLIREFTELHYRYELVVKEG